jgi:hypothetical protein
VKANWNKTAAPPGVALANCTGQEYWNLITATSAVVPSGINATGSPADPGEGPDPGIHVKYGLALPDAQTDLSQFIPDDSQPLVTSLATDCHTIDPYFDTTTYVGAFDPTQAAWLMSPWISFELQ